MPPEEEAPFPVCPRATVAEEVDAADVDGSTSASGVASSSSTDGTARDPEPEPEEEEERLASLAGTAARKSSWAVHAARFASRSASSGESCARVGC